MEVLASARSLLRDALITLEHAPGGVVNTDAQETVGRLVAATGTAGVLAALDAVAAAEQAVRHNVTPQLAFEVMLLDIRKALSCPS